MRTPNGFTGVLVLQSGSGPYGEDVKRLSFSMYFETEKRIRLRITDPQRQRWEVPNVVLSKTPAISPKNLQYEVQINKYPFSFIIKRLEGSTIFNSTSLPFVYEDQFISIGTRLPPNPYIYGLGERVHPLRLNTNDFTFTMFNKDDTNTENKNLYGSHPFYMELRPDGHAHGVFLLNSNAMDAVFSNNPKRVQFNMIGGVIDMFFFVGPRPDDVLQQYHEVIGFPALPAYWTLGWHQCRYGYHNIDEVETVVQKYKDNKIPLDTIWSDIDYMDAYKDFTLDPVNFPADKMQQFVKKIHDNHQQYVVIVDPGIKVEKGYKPYDIGLEKNAFIMKKDGSEPIQNKVWPGITVFPDFFNPNIYDYWFNLVKEFLDLVNVDGLWLDMNEIATFCNGVCNDTSNAKGEFNPNHPPYVPGGVDLTEKTLSLDALTKFGPLYNSHNLYGLYECNMTRIVLEKLTGKRAFILSRSNFAGLGHYVAHWTGDNWSSWRSMKLSIPGIANMGMFGVSLVGSDICGFLNDTTEELCIRWTQLGSFYPFSRNHNDKKAKPQEPYVFGERMIRVARDVLMNRYSLLPYYYTQFYKVHVQGGAMFRALFLEFPELVNDGVGDIDEQFMIGHALMVSPVVTQGATSVNVYFAPGRWYDYYSGVPLDISTSSTTVGKTITLDAPLEKINAHIRGGHIIPKQTPGMTSYETRQNPYQIVVALNQTNYASGELYLDDGESLNTVKQGNYTHMTFFANPKDATSGVVQSTFLHQGYDMGKNHVIDSFNILGVYSKICSVTLNQQSIETYQYSDDKKQLVVDQLNYSLGDKFILEWKSCANI